MNLCVKIAVLFVFVFSSLVSAEAKDKSLFKYDGKEYKSGELTTRSKLESFDVENEYFRKMETLLENEILDLYFEEQAKKQKKTIDELVAKEMAVPEPTEKEMKRFFDSNKSRMPVSYTYEQLKPQIAMVLKQEKQYEKRKALVAKVKKAKSYQLLLSAPVAPKVNIETKGFPAAGSSKAKVQIVEFADYTCVHCKNLNNILHDVVKKFKNKVEVVFIPFVLSDHGPSNAMFAGAHCAMKQNKFLEYNKMAFDNQNSINNDSPMEFAKTLKLNQDEFKKCLATTEAKDLAKNGSKIAFDLGLNGTPTTFINGVKYSGAPTLEDISKAINNASSR